SGFHRTEATLTTPGDERGLRAFLTAAHAAGERVTLRGAGLSLDRQSVGTRLLSLARFRRLAIDRERQRVTVGAGVTWGEVFDATTRVGLVPPILPTTRQSTVGGTLSANSLSRFSPLHGREG